MLRTLQKIGIFGEENPFPCWEKFMYKYHWSKNHKNLLIRNIEKKWLCSNLDQSIYYLILLDYRTTNCTQVLFYCTLESSSTYLLNIFLTDQLYIHRQATRKVYFYFGFKNSMNTIGKLVSHVCIEVPLTKSTIHVVDKLAVNIIFGTSLFKKKFFSMLWFWQNLVSSSQKSVSLLSLLISGANVNGMFVATSGENPELVTNFISRNKLCVA